MNALTHLSKGFDSCTGEFDTYCGDNVPYITPHVAGVTCSKCLETVVELGQEAVKRLKKGLEAEERLREVFVDGS